MAAQADPDWRCRSRRREVTRIGPPSPLRPGYQAGYQQGYAGGQQQCGSDRDSYGGGHRPDQNEYNRGFADGYNAGHQAACNTAGGGGQYDQSYAQGYQAGYQQGYAGGQQQCGAERDSYGGGHRPDQNEYNRGFAAGYNAGHEAACNNGGSANNQTTGGTTGGEVPDCRAGREVQVPGNQAWTSTGIVVSAHQWVAICGFGTVHSSDNYGNPKDDRSPDGEPGCTAPNGGGFPGPGLHCYSLIGRLGDWQPFAVGHALSGRTGGDGWSQELLLGMNDNFLNDNHGAWTVWIAVR